MRRLEQVVNAQEQIYVRKDVLDAQQAATDQQLVGIETEIHEVWRRFDKIEDAFATNRRLIISSFIAPIIVGIVVVLLLSAFGLHK